MSSTVFLSKVWVSCELLAFLQVKQFMELVKRQKTRKDVHVNAVFLLHIYVKYDIRILY